MLSRSPAGNLTVSPSPMVSSIMALSYKSKFPAEIASSIATATQVPQDPVGGPIVIISLLSTKPAATKSQVGEDPPFTFTCFRAYPFPDGSVMVDPVSESPTVAVGKATQVAGWAKA